MTDVATVLSSVKTAYELARILKDSSTSLAEAEQKLKLADIISSLADVKIEMAEVQSLLLEKDLRIQELENQIKLQEEVEYEPPYYWKIIDDKKDGPFCQHCFDNEKKMIRLQSRGNGTWLCRVCHNTYRDKTYQKPPSRPRRSGGWVY